MFRKIASIAVTFCLVTGSAPVAAQSTAGGSFILMFHVPVACNVRHDPTGTAMTGDKSAVLGELDEYCNSPNGYEVVVNYTPGSLRGTVLAVGDDRVTLDGSGSAVLSRSAGPRIRHRVLTAVAGANGFDAPSLNVAMQVA